jgi:hypothetical protein
MYGTVEPSTVTPPPQGYTITVVFNLGARVPSGGGGANTSYGTLEPALILALTKIRPPNWGAGMMPETSSVISLTGQNHINN